MSQAEPFHFCGCAKRHLWFVGLKFLDHLHRPKWGGPHCRLAHRLRGTVSVLSRLDEIIPECMFPPKVECALRGVGIAKSSS